MASSIGWAADEQRWYETQRARIEREYLTGVHIPEDVEIELTCESCPEQYDVRRGGQTIGYIRFRFGKLEVRAPTVAGETVFLERWPDDPYRSDWDTQDQRAHDLTRFLEMLVRRDDQTRA